MDRELQALEPVAKALAATAVSQTLSFCMERKYLQDITSEDNQLFEIEALPSTPSLVIHCTDCEGWLKRQSVLGFTVSKLSSAQFRINNQVNLCDSCKHNYPNCPAGKDDVLYGNSKGGDNICTCNKYKAQEIEIGCNTCEHNGKKWNEPPCDVCLGHSAYEPKIYEVHNGDE